MPIAERVSRPVELADVPVHLSAAYRNIHERIGNIGANTLIRRGKEVRIVANGVSSYQWLEGEVGCRRKIDACALG